MQETALPMSEQCKAIVSGFTVMASETMPDVNATIVNDWFVLVLVVCSLTCSAVAMMIGLRMILELR